MSSTPTGSKPTVLASDDVIDALRQRIADLTYETCLLTAEVTALKRERAQAEDSTRRRATLRPAPSADGQV